ncbi:hypothetical protein [Dankookia sp. P2]|uniref:hypothetical protein n=1 Tax=Dankookia sp. P2 TaxID=3423955 RepID=UPI003D66F905
MVATKRLTFFTAGYSQVATVFPFVVAAPAYFAGKIPLGGLTQTANAFGEVQGRSPGSSTTTPPSPNGAPR